MDMPHRWPSHFSQPEYWAGMLLTLSFVLLIIFLLVAVIGFLSPDPRHALYRDFCWLFLLASGVCDVTRRHLNRT